ncbi:MAG TPA: OadG family protein [Tenuifilaceae bacterium]|nr:OadG family protein [Tenuifilaceae bacterium]
MNLLLVIATVGQAKTSSAADEFVRLDPYGVGMAMIAMSVVIGVLAFAYFVFHNLSKLYSINFRRPAKKADEQKGQVVQENTTGEEMAAISMALHLYKSAIHDHESAVLTINKMGKNYSPWSSKIYGIMNSVPSVKHIKR